MSWKWSDANKHKTWVSSKVHWSKRKIQRIGKIRASTEQERRIPQETLWHFVIYFGSSKRRNNSLKWLRSAMGLATSFMTSCKIAQEYYVQLNEEIVEDNYDMAQLSGEDFFLKMQENWMARRGSTNRSMERSGNGSILAYKMWNNEPHIRAQETLRHFLVWFERIKRDNNSFKWLRSARDLATSFMRSCKTAQEYYVQINEEIVEHNYDLAQLAGKDFFV